MKRSCLAACLLLGSALSIGTAAAGGLPGGKNAGRAEEEDTSSLQAAAAAPVTAAVEQQRQDQATLTVRSATPGVRVFVDSGMVGTVPLDSCPVVEGTHIIHFIHPDARRWLNAAVVETLLVHPGEHIVLTPAFAGEFFSVFSVPYGATVRSDSMILGQTPLTLPAPGAPQSLTLSKEGFEETTIPLHGSVTVTLRPLAPAAPGESRTTPSLFLSANQTKSSLPIYLTTAATVLTGTLAAYFKIKADNAYSDYRLNGDALSLDRVHRNDAASAVALAACEVNLLALTYFLFSR